jgi:16S rRNA (adenine1518-N6/adenine1519-N6)-dimethyltransferase
MLHSRRPKLGQHFLASEGYRQRIVQALSLRPDDLVVEIGPGRGAMTEQLAERAHHVVAVELDVKLAEELRAQLKESPNIAIVQSDILATDVAALCRNYGSSRCFVFGNLPYFITSPIIHHLMASANSIHGMALLVQREVAERLAAEPGSRDFGYLTVLVQLHSEPRIVLQVPPGAFSPPPKVHSALVEFKMRPRFPAWSHEEQARFLAFAKACFARKRKNLLNNLGATYGRERVLAAIAALHLPPTARAEEQGIEQLAELSILLT